jgi:hypothetical protein
MSVLDWATLAVCISTILGALAISVRHLVKYYLFELRSNGGTSLKDKVDSLEKKVEFLTEFVIEAFKK